MWLQRKRPRQQYASRYRSTPGVGAGVSQERLGPQVLPRDWEVGKRREVRNELALPIERLLEATIIVRTLQARQRVEHG